MSPRSLVNGKSTVVKGTCGTGETGEFTEIEFIFLEKSEKNAWKSLSLENIGKRKLALFSDKQNN